MSFIILKCYQGSALPLIVAMEIKTISKWSGSETKVTWTRVQNTLGRLCSIPNTIIATNWRHRVIARSGTWARSLVARDVTDAPGRPDRPATIDYTGGHRYDKRNIYLKKNRLTVDANRSVMLKRHLRDLHLYMHFMQNFFFFNFKPLDIRRFTSTLQTKKLSEQQPRVYFL